MNKFIQIFILVNFIALTSFGQNGMINWERNYGGSGNDCSYVILQTTDLGYLTAGYNWSDDGDVHGHHGASWYPDAWVVRLNEIGDTLWTISLGGTYDDYANSAIQTSDGGFIIAAQTSSDNGDVTLNHGSTDAWLIKINDSGIIEWQKSYGGSGYDYALSIDHTHDGNYIIAGATSSTNGDISNPLGGNDYWIFKIDNSGTLLWEKTLGGSSDEYAFSVITTEDNGFIIGGYSWSSDGDVSANNGILDYWIVKTDSLANIQWEKNLGGNYFDYGNYALPINDGGYMIVGQSNSDDQDISNPLGGNDAWVVKLDSLGNIEWERGYGGSQDDVFYNVAQTAEGGFIFAGRTTSTDGDVSDNYELDGAWIVKTDFLGNIDWEESFGGDSLDYANFVIQQNDGSFTFAGLSNSINYDVANNNGAVDMWVVNLKCVPLVAPEICMVTVDSISGKNVVVWDPSGNSGVESYYVYRESFIAGQYNAIGMVSAGEDTQFEDIFSDPAIQANRYKIQAIDTCGNMSEMSGYHETMHLNVNTAGGGGFNLIWNHYLEENGGQVAFGDGSYYIYRGTNPNNMLLHYTISSSNTSWTDTDDTQLYYYRITAKKLDSCFVSAAKAQGGPYSQSYSNMDDNAVQVGINNPLASNDFAVYPNPYSGSTNITINLNASANINLDVYDILGEYVATLHNGILAGGNHNFKFSGHNIGLSSGIYYLRFTKNNKVINKKIVELD